MDSTLSISRTTGGLSLIAAPLCFAASSFFWSHTGEYGVVGGTLLNLSMVPWVIAFVVLFGKLRQEMPVYASIGLVVAIYGCLAGANFGFVGVFNDAFEIPHKTYLETIMHYPFSAKLLLYWGGPLFPLSMLIVGIVLIRKKKIAPWLGVLLCAGAIAFPLSRIPPRIENLAHAVDVLFAIPLIVMGCQEIFPPRPQKMMSQSAG